MEPISAAVTDTGRLFAVDISPKFVEYIKNRAKKLGLKNVEVIFSRKDSGPEAAYPVAVVNGTAMSRRSTRCRGSQIAS